jgi:hypothetical protein
MSALPPIADMVQHDRDVRFVPNGNMTPLGAATQRTDAAQLQTGAPKSPT